MTPWFDGATAGWVGAVVGVLGGLWGSVLGVAGGLLIPKGKGKPFVFGLLWLGAAAGVGLLATGLTALAVGQPYHVWYGFLIGGVVLTGLAVSFVFVMRNRYRQVELRKMTAEELG